ncbi:hypothetical protein M1N23_01195 [Dehalococcoidia bacterium]|nr:hypothetical protein [Dehalococcoidia bacterium]
MAETIKVKAEGRWYVVEVEDLSATPIRTLVDGHSIDVEFGSVLSNESTPVQEPTPQTPPTLSASHPDPTPSVPPVEVVRELPSATKLFVTPMPGTIFSLAVIVGDQVVTGDPICVLEAMKMKQVLKADWSGVVKAVHVVIGQQVREGHSIVELE